MCSFCLATMGIVLASAVSTGGLTALAVKLSRGRNNPKKIPNPNSRARCEQTAPANRVALSCSCRSFDPFLAL
jgi:hypothetical protein